MSIVRKATVKGEVETPACEKCGEPLKLGTRKPVFNPFHEGAKKLGNGLICETPVAHDYWFSPCSHCTPPHVVIRKLVC